MSRFPWFRFTTRSLIILVGSVAVALVGYLALLNYGYRMAMRAERSNNATMERLNKEYERRMRDEIASFQRAEAAGEVDKEMTDHLFERLRLSRVAANSREVSHWESAPESPERRAVALKWAETAADEAEYLRKLYEIWDRDYERGLEPHQITEDEVKTFAMPEGRTLGDSKY